MSLLHALRHRLRALVRPEAFSRELDEELRFHLSLEAMQRATDARASLSPAEANDAARRRLGNTTVLIEETRRMAGLSFFDMAQQDVRFAWRSFRRTPAFTIVAVLTLAIGIGATTAIFSAVNALLLRPLPFREPEQLMKISLTVPARGDSPASDDVVWSYPKFVVFRDAQRLYQSLTAWADNQITLRIGEQVSRERVEVIDARYLPTLGVQPVLGRNLLPEEDTHPGGPRVALLSNELWQRAFNADPAVLGRSVDVEGKPFTIIGVLPAGFRGFSGRTTIWTAIMASSAEDLNEAWSHYLTVVGRLKPGVTPATAKAIVPQLGMRVDAAYRHPQIKDEHWGAVARELDAIRVDPIVRRTLLVLLGAVVLVLLIACANVANLFLVRASGRRREIAVRLAVGAGRGRLVRQLLTESVLLSSMGGVASVFVAWSGVKMLASLEPATVLRTELLQGLGVVTFAGIRLDPVAFAFAAALAITTGLLFGLVPALLATRPSLTGALKDDRSPEGVRTRVSSRTVLAVAELALALVLLAGSGLMLRSLGQLLDVRTGIDASHVLTMRFNAGTTMGRDSLPALYDAMLERLGALPGVTDVALGNCPPLSGGCNGTTVWLRDRPPVAAGTEPDVGVHWITPQWATTLRVPLVRGRMFTRADRVGAPKVVMVSETAARRLWPNQDPIGRPISVGQGGFSEDTARVVGVLGDVRFGTLDSLPRSEVFLSYYQSPFRPMLIYVRAQGDPLSLASAARRAMHDVAPDAPVYDVQTLEARVAGATAYARFSALLLALFAAVALALATIGVYGVISFAVAQRTREIGVRVALGATRGDVIRLVVGQGMAIATAGGIIGLAAAFAVTRVLRAMLYGVAPSDPWTFAGVVAVLGLAVVAASWIPARRASGITPSEALREG